MFSSAIFATRNIKTIDDDNKRTTASSLTPKPPPLVLSSLSEHSRLRSACKTTTTTTTTITTTETTVTPVRATTNITRGGRKMEATNFSFWRQMNQISAQHDDNLNNKMSQNKNVCIKSTTISKQPRCITTGKHQNSPSTYYFNAQRVCNLESLATSFILLITLLTVFILASCSQSTVFALSTDGSTQQQNKGVTKAYAEPIKWSFGGWAPLDGTQKNISSTGQTNGNNNGVNESASKSATSPSVYLNSHHHSNSRTTSKPSNLAPSQPPLQSRPLNLTKPAYEMIRQQTQTQRDALSESASSSRENVHFASPSQPGPYAMHQSRVNGGGGQSMQLHTGPAYSLPLQRPPQFSLPAPKPIIREQLLPSANNEQNRFNNVYSQQMPQNRHYHHHHRQQQQQQQHQHQHQHQHHLQQQMNHMPRPPPDFYKHQQNMQQIQQQMMHHHQIMMQQRQQQIQQQAARANVMQPHPGQQHANSQKGYNMFPMMEPPQQPGRSIPHYPGSPFMHHHNQQQQQQKQQAQDVPPVGAFKVIEGEQPIIFTSPQSNERIPMIEVSANQQTNGGHRNESSGQQQASEKQSIEPTASTQPMPPYSSTLAAIEKDNLNYQNALNQVTNYSQDEQQQQHINNIQDIKQKQQMQVGDQGKASGSKPSYLTIPVAVETEGDKVLTPDDINEIEKHVINVLPNLKTADKIVKIADAQLSLANIKSAAENHHQQQQQQEQGKIPEMHQINYEEHRTTMKQLEGDIKQQQQEQQQLQQPQQNYGPSSPSQEQQVTHAPSGYGSSAPASMNQATTATAQHVEDPSQQQQQQQQQQIMAEHQYFVATGPLQEIGTVDPDQVADYNLIKNDLLNNFRYEPTRANSANKPQQHTASTPPMPYSVSLAQSPPLISMVSQQYNNNNMRSNNNQGRPSVTRYFHQGTSTTSMNSQQPPTPRPYSRANNLFGRLNGPQQQQQQPIRGGGNYGSGNQQQLTSTTKTIMGGRKVSEVMRPLIHTTPVPMTSPIHVPSVEPEKVDAIQLIAGQANDKQPMVVEAHQLVNHTPDGGIDYSSGMSMQQQQAPQFQQPDLPQQQQQQQQHLMPQHPRHQQMVHHQQNHSAYEQQAGDRQQQQYAPPMAQDSPDNNQNAIIEYVAISDQALNNAMAKQQHQSGGQQQQQQQQGYEIASGPEVQPVYVQEQPQPQQQQQQQRLPQQVDNSNNNNRAPFLYDYTISTQHKQSLDANTMQPTPPTYMINTQPAMMSQPEAQPSLAWSPSVANEHQQQQVELSEHAGPMHQLEMPATAGYNFFGHQDQQHQQQSTPAVQQQQQQQQEYEELQQQQEQQQKQHESNQRWRSKAGGSQPNPDAQYDGQFVKGAQEQAAQNDQQEQQAIEEQQQQRQYFGNQQQPTQQQAVELARISSASSQKPQEDRSEQQIQVVENQQNQNDNGLSEEAYQQQNQQQQQQQNQYQISTPSASQQPMVEEYPSTNSYVAGAQINHNTSPNYDQQQQQQYAQQQTSTPDRFAYMKLDRDRQQNHLAQQQAQHQAQLAEIMNSQQANYQTTTPMSLTTLATIEQQQQQDIQQEQQQPISGSNNNNNNNNGYIVEQVQSRPSVQSSPDSMIVNESPMQVPILDQQSLIADNNEEYSASSDDEGAKQRQQSQPAGVYQVYQAYYAPKDHKPLPGYVRLSLDEFNELFRDAEIQYVDRNLNGLAVANNQQPQQQQHLIRNPQGQQSQLVESMQAHAYEQQPPNDVMKASASENQSIVVDRRSISQTERRAFNSSSSEAATNVDHSTTVESPKNRPEKKLKLGRAVKKIISIRNSNKQLAKQAKLSHRPVLGTNSDIQSPTTSATFVMTDLNIKNQTITRDDLVSSGKNKHQAKLVQPSKRKTDITGKKVHNQQVIKSKNIMETTTSENVNIKKNSDDKKLTKIFN